MPFRPLAAPLSARWRSADGEGLEHLTITPFPERGTIGVRSVVVGVKDGRRFGLLYEVRLGADWRTQGFLVQTTDGRRLGMHSFEPGRWEDTDRVHRAEFDGCLDIDIEATPFTNTLPIRRRGLNPADGEVELPMLYIPIATLAPVRRHQFYRALDAERRYRFSTEDRSFAADLPLDEDGLVLHYPTLFERL